jgi:hypothetical protein
MKVKWGMGPADVRDVYPAIDSIWASAEEPTRTFLVRDEFIEGLVGMHFEFYRGRLYEVSVSPFLGSKRSREPSDADEEQARIEARLWRTSVLKILHEKYGSPWKGPTPAEVAVAEETQQTGLHDLSWYWKSGKETGIQFVRRNSVLQFLTYLNIGALGRDAWQAAEAHKQAQEDARKAKF